MIYFEKQKTNACSSLSLTSINLYDLKLDWVIRFKHPKSYHHLVINISMRVVSWSTAFFLVQCWSHFKLVMNLKNRNIFKENSLTTKFSKKWHKCSKRSISHFSPFESWLCLCSTNVPILEFGSQPKHLPHYYGWYQLHFLQLRFFLEDIFLSSSARLPTCQYAWSQRQFWGSRSTTCRERLWQSTMTSGMASQRS